MKLLILSLAIIFILLQPQARLPDCYLALAKLAIPPRIFAEIAIDDNTQNVIYTRILHNKAGIFLSEFSRCYFNVFDFNYLHKQLSMVGLAGFLYFVYQSLTKKRVELIVFIALLPLILFFKLPLIILAVLLKLTAVIGLTVFLVLREKDEPK